MAVDVKSFATLLAKELARRGIPREIAVKHAVSLVRTFDEEDLREISAYTSCEEFADLSDSLAELIKDKNVLKTLPAEKSPDLRTEPAAEPVDPAATGTFTVQKKKEEPDVSMGATREIPVQGGAERSDGLEHMKTKAFDMEIRGVSAHTQAFTGLRTSDITIKTDTSSEITMINLPVADSYSDDEPEIYINEEDEDYGDEEEKVVLTKRGRGFFVGIAIATAPFTLILALLVLSVFAIGIVAVCAFIAASLLAVCGEAVVGSGLTLVGVIYGAIEIVSGNMATGIYEIGLGICCGGVALCLGILTYNFAVVLLPYFLKQLIAFEGYCLKRVGPMLNRFREECNRL